MTNRKTKLMVIGLDGATYDLILPWIKKGELPNFKKLISESAWTPLDSTRPPLTCPAWPVFYTGKNPGKIGVIDFIGGEDGNKIISYTDIKGLAFWDIASRYGMKSIVINVPITYPPRIEKGFLLSGMLTPPGKPFWSSEEIMDDIFANVGEYIVDLDILTLSSFDRSKSLKLFYFMMEQRFKTAMFLKNKQPHDIMVVVFQGTDIVCHRLWNNSQEVLKVYRLMDDYIGELSKNVEYLILMSDHGFAGYERGVRINQFLFERGDLKRRKAAYDSGFTHGSKEILEHRFGGEDDKGLKLIKSINKFVWYSGINRAFIKKIARNERVVEWLKRSAPSITKKLIPPDRFIVDRQKSISYLHSSRTRSICINRDRIPSGMSYDSYKKRLIEDLLLLKDLETGKQVIGRVYQRHELYNGPYEENFPDLYLETRQEYIVRGNFGPAFIEKFTVPKSSHGQKGIFLCRGLGIKPGYYDHPISIQDLAPTMLYLLGFPIPRDMDGKVHIDILESSRRKHVEYTEETSCVKENTSVSREEEKELMAKLRAIGYMD